MRCRAAAACLLLAVLLLSAAAQEDGSQHSSTLSEVAPADRARELYDAAESFRLGTEGKAVDMAAAVSNYVEASQLSGSGAAAAACALATLYEEGVPGVLTQDMFEAARLYNASAAGGNATAQFTMAVLHSYGLFGVPHDDTLATVYYYFAAVGGVPEASLVLGYRHAGGLSVPLSCPTSLQYYEAAADAVSKQYTDRGGVLPSVKRLMLNDDAVETLGDEDSMDDHYEAYYKSKVDSEPALLPVLGQWYYYGSRGLPQDFAAAAECFLKAEKMGITSDASLGMLYLHGRGVPRDVTKAKEYLLRAAANGDGVAMNGVGYMYLHGLGVEKDLPAALSYIKTAADANVVDAKFNLAMMRIQGLGVERDFREAGRLLQSAQSQGHVQAGFVMAELMINGLGGSFSCEQTQQQLRHVAMKGLWAELFDRATVRLRGGDALGALLDFLRLSEMGYVEAQVSAAYLLDEVYVPAVRALNPQPRRQVAATQAPSNPPVAAQEGGTRPPMPSSPLRDVHAPSTTEEANAPQATYTHTPAEPAPTPSSSRTPSPVEAAEAVVFKLLLQAGATHLESVLKLGDFYYYGWAGLEPSPTKAAAYYQRAASEGRLPQALYNIGYIHEYGVGLARDLHLAKRNYDEAMAIAPAAFYPVSLCLLRIRLKIWWESETLASPSLPSPFTRSLASLGMSEDALLAFTAVQFVGLLYWRAIRRARAQSFFYRQLIAQEKARLAGTAQAQAGPAVAR